MTHRNQRATRNHVGAFRRAGRGAQDDKRLSSGLCACTDRRVGLSLRKAFSYSRQASWMRTCDLSDSDIAMLEQSAVTHSLRVLTVNVHKGFSFLNRRFVLPELRDAVREVAADVVFLQEVHGSRQRHASAGARLARGAARRVPGRSDLAGLRLWPQCRLRGRRPRQRGAVEVPDRALREHRHLGRWPGEARAAALRDSPARACGHDARHLCAPRAEAGAPRTAARPLVRARALRRAADRTAAGGRRLQRLAEGRACRARAWRGPARGLRRCARARRAPYPARFPMLQLDRIYVRSTRHHAPLALPAQPWDRLSDHTPIAAEIQL